MNGWIKLHRKILEWDWYTDPNTMRLFIHLLLKANCEPGEWRGYKIMPGQLITSLRTLTRESRLSEREVRTALTKLKSTNELSLQTTSQFSIITICNWEDYQQQNSSERQTKRQTARQTNDNKQEDKKKEDNKYNAFYDYQLTLSYEYLGKYPEAKKDVDSYKKFVDWLFGANGFKVIDVLGNIVETRKSNLLRLEKQLSFLNYTKLKSDAMGNVMPIFEAMENWGKLKERKDFYKTAITFLKNTKK